MSKNAVVDLGQLSKPANTLIKKVSAAVGGLFEPYQRVRLANADVKADLIRAEGEIRVTELHRRAVQRFVEEEALHQQNMEAIAAKALPLLTEQAQPEEIADDWLRHFFGKNRSVSNEQMQELWGRILAGEANSPGSFSRRTLNILDDLDVDHALLFSRLCSFCWDIRGPTPLVYDFGTTENIYSKHGLTFANLSELESIGLIRFDNASGFILYQLRRTVPTRYFDKELALIFPNDLNELQIGSVILTKAGSELFGVCQRSEVPGFFEFVEERWRRRALLGAEKHT